MVSASRICTCAMAGDVSRTTATGIRYFNLRLLCGWVHVLQGVSLSVPYRINWHEAPAALRPPLLGCACRRRERPCGPSRIRPCGLTAALHPASRFARLASTSLPGRSARLRSGLFWPEAKTIPPLHPSPASGRAVCLLASGKPTVKTHTHMSAEAYPPDGPQISPPQGSQNFSARAGSVGRTIQCARLSISSEPVPGKLLRPASRRLRRP